MSAFTLHGQLKLPGTGTVCADISNICCVYIPQMLSVGPTQTFPVN